MGATITALTLQPSPATRTTESGSVSINGSVSDDAKQGANQSQVFTLPQAGVTQANQLGIILNLNENPNDNTATVNSLSLSVYSAAGGLLGTFSTAQAYDVTQVLAPDDAKLATIVSPALGFNAS